MLKLRKTQINMGCLQFIAFFNLKIAISIHVFGKYRYVCFITPHMQYSSQEMQHKVFIYR